MDMEHPLINDLGELTVEQLQDRITELNKKLMWSMRMNNAAMAGQLRLAIASFQSAYQQRLQADIAEKNKNQPDHTDKIRIT